ncbi:MAG: glycosyltransferase [Thiothrix sp.]
MSEAYLTKPERIAVVIYSLTKGGAERVASLLSEQFAHTHAVDLIVFDGRLTAYPHGGTLVDLDCPASSNPWKKTLNLFRRFYKLRCRFQQHHYTHIFSFMESANFPTLLASRRAVVSVRNNPRKFSPVTRWMMRLLYPRAHKVIAVSTAIADMLEQNLGLQNVTSIPNPLDFHTIDLLKKQPVEHPRPYLLAIGRLHPQKGFDLLINAFANSKASQTTDLLILGEGGQRANLQQQIEHLGLTEKIHLPGMANNPYRYLDNAQIFILSSRYEGYPNVLLEALACRCPVIATNCPTGPNEILTHGVNGILINNENTDELTKSIDYLMENPELCAAFRQQGVNAVTHLELGVIAQRWLEL